jgi:hypothetical protein
MRILSFVFALVPTLFVTAIIGTTFAQTTTPVAAAFQGDLRAALKKCPDTLSAPQGRMTGGSVGGT